MCSKNPLLLKKLASKQQAENSSITTQKYAL